MESTENIEVVNIPNALTAETIDNAHKGIGLDKPIEDIDAFVKSL